MIHTGMIFVSLAIMALINLTINNYGASEEVLQKLTQMAENFDQLKAKVDALSTQVETVNTNIDGVVTSVTNVADDIAYLKEQLQGMENGATAEQIAQLTATVDGMSTKHQDTTTKLSTLSTTLTDLDAQTTRPTTEG